MKSETKNYTLYLFGRSPPLLNALLVSLIVAASSGITEEMFFRGFVFQVMEKNSFTSFAVFASAAIFGLAHFPQKDKANAFLEACLGGMLAVAYGACNYNIAVPIVMHGFYDFLTIVITWIESNNELKQILSVEDAKMLSIKTLSQSDFNDVANLIFTSIDENGSGKISQKELLSAVTNQR